MLSPTEYFAQCAFHRTLSMPLRQGYGGTDKPARANCYCDPISEFAYFFAAIATTLPAVTWGGFGSKEAMCCLTKSAAVRLDSSSASLVAKTLTEIITPFPASTQ